MKHNHVFLCKRHLLLIENVAVLETNVILLVEEALFLNAGHVENVNITKYIFKSLGSCVRNASGIKNVLSDVVRYLQLRRAYENEFIVRVAAHCFCKGMYGAAKLQISAEANRVPFKTAAKFANGK